VILGGRVDVYICVIYKGGIDCSRYIGNPLARVKSSNSMTNTLLANKSQN